MAKFIGTWAEDSSVPRVNFAELLDKVGVNSDIKEKLVNSTATYSITLDGDTFTVVVTTSAFPEAEKSYPFKSGEPFSALSMDGTPYTSTITVSGDDTMTEVGKNEKYGDFEISRKVEGDVLKCTQKMAGITMTYQMKRA